MDHINFLQMSFAFASQDHVLTIEHPRDKNGEAETLKTDWIAVRHLKAGPEGLVSDGVPAPYL